MKTTLLLASFVLSYAMTQAQEVSYAESPDYQPPVAYTAPVVYQAPVVYEAPVTYYAPVYYLASAATAASYAGAERPCPTPSTVVHITGGRGTYTSSYCAGTYESTVVHIGSRQPRIPGYFSGWWHY